MLDGLNRYTYVGNNPLRYVDTTGHWCLPGPLCDLVDTANDVLEGVDAVVHEIDDVVNDGLGTVGLCHQYGDTGADCVTFKEAHPEDAQNAANVFAGVLDGVVWGEGDRLLIGLGQSGKYDPNSVELGIGEVLGVGANALAGGGFGKVGGRYITANVTGNIGDMFIKDQSVGDTTWNLGILGLFSWLPKLFTRPLGVGAAGSGSARLQKFADVTDDAVGAAWSLFTTYTSSGNGGSPLRSGGKPSNANS